MNEVEALREAVKIGSQSTCHKSKRGVVIWRPESGVIASGYNDPPKGFICDGSAECRAHCGQLAVHAEQAARLHEWVREPRRQVRF